ncbi:MAG: hypothetical protein HY059_01355 [Proteobacteria bacterium]|nr:hypothetical protein [Pseudomonadota bacterium]
MIRIATWLWVAIAGVMGYGLYQLKHEVIALENELFRLNRQIVQEQQNIHVLKAEWSYINQPQRLQALAQRHLDLMPMTPRQIGRLEALPALPAQVQTAASLTARRTETR